ncbi:MAG: iron-siderophore ABC transporter substrate-binding protein [Nocardioidaceae bacterium]|nr:iron-siderophore ABC transporter substrate-binding protein [Nocardioidaceae bacterium]
MRLAHALAAATLALALAACSGAEETGTEGDETRSVEHALGTSEVPVDPQRVVVLDTGELDAMLALGITPVGAVEIDSANEYLTYLADRTEDIEDVGAINEPDLERVAALQPDLILTNTVRHEDLYDQLSKIAPTVMAPNLGVAWKDSLALYAEAVGRSDEAATLLGDYEDRAAEVGAAIDAQSVGLVRFTGDAIRLYSDRSFPGVVLSDMGKTVPAAALGQDTFVELSPENLDDADADAVLVATSAVAEQSEVEAATGGPVWAQLQAVQQDQVLDIGDDLVSGINIMAAGELVDAIGEGLAD